MALESAEGLGYCWALNSAQPLVMRMVAKLEVRSVQTCLSAMGSLKAAKMVLV